MSDQRPDGSRENELDSAETRVAVNVFRSCSEEADDEGESGGMEPEAVGEAAGTEYGLERGMGIGEDGPLDVEGDSNGRVDELEA